MLSEKVVTLIINSTQLIWNFEDSPKRMSSGWSVIIIILGRAVLCTRHGTGAEASEWVGMVPEASKLIGGTGLSPVLGLLLLSLVLLAATMTVGVASLQSYGNGGCVITAGDEQVLPNVAIATRLKMYAEVWARKGQQWLQTTVVQSTEVIHPLSRLTTGHGALKIKDTEFLGFY